MVKFVAYGWSGSRSLPAVRDQVWAALSAARQSGWDGLLAEQRAYLDDFWDRADVEVDGDTEVQQAVRFALFHVLQAGARGGEPGDPGQGPDRARVRRARLLGHRDVRAAGAEPDRARPRPPARCAGGTAPSRRPSSGRPSSGCRARPSPGGRSPARSARATGPPARPPSTSTPTSPTRWSATSTPPATRSSPADAGMDLLIHTARLWRSLGHHDDHGPVPHRRGHRPRRVQRAGRQQRLHQPDGHGRTWWRPRTRRSAIPDRARELGVDPEESAGWRDAAAGDVHPLRRGARRAPAGRGLHPPPGLGLRPHLRRSSTRCCCTSPTSTCTASRSSSRPTWCWPCTCAGTPSPPSRRSRNFDYYEPLTVRDSSLSACTQAVMAAEVGHLDLAFDYLGEAALMDLQDLEHNTRDGVHIASLAGAWVALVGGFGGLRHQDSTGQLRAPAPRGHRQAQVQRPHPGPAAARRGDPRPGPVRAGRRRAAQDHPLRPGTESSAGKTQTRPIPPLPARPRPSQPPGREPAHRVTRDQG